jgi:hypothetical protein
MFWMTSMLIYDEASVGCAGVAGCGWGALLTRKFVSSLTSQQGLPIHKPPYRLDDDPGLCHFLSPRAPPPRLPFSFLLTLAFVLLSTCTPRPFIRCIHTCRDFSSYYVTP